MNLIFESKLTVVGKTILSVLGIISLLWIGYVCINLSSLGDRLTPETVFGKADESVVIVHKPLEPDYTDPAFEFLAKNEFYAALLTHTERVQHFYFSSSRPVVLLERSKPWTIELIDRYFASMAISTTVESAKSISLSNGWHVLYNKEYLLITKSDNFSPGESTVQWQYVDKKSSATLVEWKNGIAVIENAYRNSVSEISYISENASSVHAITDDQETFQDIIPAKFSEFEFFEKEYLRSTGGAKSPLFEWIQTGAMIIRFNNKTCIVTDCISGQDPIAILGNSLDENSVSPDKNKAFIQNVSLPDQLLSAKNWYVEVFNNRVFIATNQQAIDAIIGAYETGATLSQDQELRIRLFEKAPKRVSYRKINAAEHRSFSLLEHSKHTVVQQLGGKVAEPEEIEEEETTASVRIDGGISQLIPIQGTDFMFVLSKQNVLYGINGDEEKWKKTISGTIIGKVGLSAGNELLITTTSEIHQVNRGGNDANGNPVKLAVTPVTEAVSYTWKGADYLAVASEQQLTVLTRAGAQKSTVKLPFAPRKNSFIVWSNAGELTATIAGKTKGINLSIDRKRKLNEFELPEGDLWGVKTANGALFVGIKQGQLIAINHKGAVSNLSGGKAVMIKEVITNGKQQIIIVKSASKISFVTTDNKVLGSVTPSFNDISSASIQTTIGGKSIITLLDGIANKNYIYALNGQLISEESFDGSNISTLHRLSDGSLMLISQSNNYLVRYPIDN
ncbi:MAG: hypothetical protein A3D31_18110 [Candidatus Fluviicola riflensis]|nr:MAG: hypothetical protein CHH17_03050 [Candidatus Fluviicola riflensis]OGS76896.1 MAG: hypothetical protein A3D31_18110 [Candidatus Fluviicola riflensis]OGS81825.1 MAG: hypothetical protein A2724_15510 [Fluviicola sp. RIFCSPHIGHO2_01_FULL_43_53]OGS88625.1 MAG: hypothetical protein A3E30_07620 [Fluviicola sp. RIFCSPHIGHO2_12_FULL_43_24]